jgi:hypothetical protein
MFHNGLYKWLRYAGSAQYNLYTMQNMSTEISALPAVAVTGRTSAPFLSSFCALKHPAVLQTSTTRLLRYLQGKTDRTPFPVLSAQIVHRQGVIQRRQVPQRPKCTECSSPKLPFTILCLPANRIVADPPELHCENTGMQKLVTFMFPTSSKSSGGFEPSREFMRPPPVRT